MLFNLTQRPFKKRGVERVRHIFNAQKGPFAVSSGGGGGEQMGTAVLLPKAAPG